MAGEPGSFKWIQPVMATLARQLGRGKHMALLILDNAQNWLLEFEEEQAREAAADLGKSLVKHR
ncbi:hypothetical protein ACYZTM_19655 [Pseudomonas sp. MDT2-39-1]